MTLFFSLLKAAKAAGKKQIGVGRKIESRERCAHALCKKKKGRRGPEMKKKRKKNHPTIPMTVPTTN